MDMPQDTTIHSRNPPIYLRDLQVSWQRHVRLSVPSEACRDHFGKGIFEYIVLLYKTK